MAWRRLGWLGVFFIAACGAAGSSSQSPAAAPPNPSPTPAVTHTLSVHVVGHGTVSSQDGRFRCSADCSTQLDGKVTLSATSAEGWQLQGFSGACSGTSCALDGSADANVTATFISPAPTRVTLSVSVEGEGSVRSSPEGISCPGTCSADFPAGTAVALTAAASGQSTFSGWTGACSGTGSCQLTLNASQSLKATFAAPVDECAGVVPSSLGPSFSGSIQTYGTNKRYCDRATSDGQGVVAGSEYGMGPTVWTLYSPTGNFVGRISDESVPLANGFQSLDSQLSSVITWSEQAQQEHTTPLGAPPTYPEVVDSRTQIFPAATGGSVVVRSNCYNPHDGQTSLTVWRIGASGEVLGKSELPDGNCAVGVEALSDAKDRTLVIVSDVAGDGRTEGRWFDETGTPLTGWFDCGPAPEDGSWIVTDPQPLIGGGAAWGQVVFPSGKARTDMGPAYLAGGRRLVVVRGGRAYAVVPTESSDTVQLFAPSGKSCGQVKLPSSGFLFVGRDGTLLQRSSTASCQLTWWPKLLI